MENGGGVKASVIPLHISVSPNSVFYTLFAPVGPNCWARMGYSVFASLGYDLISHGL